MKEKRRGCVLVLTALLGMILTGCGKADRFSDEDGARELVLRELRERYGVEFVIVGEEKYHDFGQRYGVTFSCHMAPAEEPERVSYAAVFQRAGPDLLDDYSVWAYKEQAEAPVRELLEELPGVIAYTTELNIDPLSEKWDTGKSLEEFMLANKGAVHTVIRLEEGKSGEEYTDWIMELLHRAGKLPVSTVLSVKVGERYLFWREIDATNGPPASLTRERVLEEVERNL